LRSITTPAARSTCTNCHQQDDSGSFCRKDDEGLTQITGCSSQHGRKQHHRNDDNILEEQDAESCSPVGLSISAFS